MKRKHIILGVLSFCSLAILCGVLVGANAKTKTVTVTKAEETSKTFFEKDYSNIAQANYADDSPLIQSELGFYAGHLLRTNPGYGLFNISGRSQDGPYFIVEINADEGEVLTSLQWEAAGRFYYSSGANDPRATLYVSTDPNSFDNPVKSVRGEYGAYETRTTFNADLTPYLPANTSKIYIKYIIECFKNTNGWSNDWFKITTLKIFGKQIPTTEYVAPSKNKTIKIYDDFSTTKLSASNVFHFQNVEGRASAHTLVPGLWGDPVKIADSLESFVEYMIPATSTGKLGTTKVNLNAKIWNQNDGTCHNENAIAVYAGVKEDDLTLVKEFHCTDTGAENAYKDLSEVDVTSYVAGAKIGYVKISLIQSKAANVTAGTVSINNTTYDSSNISLNNLGVKLGEVDISFQSVYQCPSTSETFLSKDFSTETDFGAESVTGFEIGNPEGSYYGIYNPNPANMASLVYKFTTDSFEKHISSMKFGFTDSRYAYYSGANTTVLKLSVSKDGTNYTNVVTDYLPTSAISKKEFDLSSAVYGLHSDVIYLKIEEGSKNPGMGSSKAWFVLKNVYVTGAVVSHDMVLANGVVICNECEQVIFSEDADVVNYYAEKYLKMSSYTESLGYCADTEHHYYADAKAMIAQLTADQKTLLASAAEFADAMARLQAWADFNGEVFDTDLVATQKSNPLVANYSNTISIVLITSALITLLAAGFIVFKRKRNNI